MTITVHDREGFIFKAVMLILVFGLIGLTGFSASAGGSARAESSPVRKEALLEGKSGEAFVKYQCRKEETKLKFSVEGFAVGEVLQIFINDKKIGSITLALDPEDGLPAGELEFLVKEELKNWIEGIPVDLPVGTFIKFINESTGEILQGSLDVI